MKKEKSGKGDGSDDAMTVKGIHIGKLLKSHFIKKLDIPIQKSNTR